MPDRSRRGSPVHRFPETGEWLITRWADCKTVGANPDVFSPSDHPSSSEARVFGTPNILLMTGTDHACLRNGIDTRLQGDVVQTYIEGLARPIVQNYVGRLKRTGAADLTKEVFEPISVRVVAAVIGLEEVDNDTLARWFHALNAGMQNAGDDPAVQSDLDRTRSEIDAVLRPKVEHLTARPDHSLLSHMVHRGLPEGKFRTYEEIIPSIVFLLGGSREPGHGAANAALGVLQSPEAREALMRDPPMASRFAPTRPVPS